MSGKGINMEIGKEAEKETIKDYLIISLKEMLKFALLGIIIFFSIGLLSIYILLEIFRVNVEIVGLISGTIVAITIFIIDIKKLHSTDKIHNANFKFIEMIFHRK